MSVILLVDYLVRDTTQLSWICVIALNIGNRMSHIVCNVVCDNKRSDGTWLLTESSCIYIISKGVNGVYSKEVILRIMERPRLNK